MNIDENLMCLPVFLAGCKKLYIVCGPTFLERLWCMLEIFVFIEMGGKTDDVQLFFIPPEGVVEPEKLQTYFEDKFATFDVAEASCYDPVQKDRLLAIVEAGFGGLDRFNAALTTTMTALKHKALHSLAGGGAVFEATSTETKSRRLAPRLPV